MNIKAQTFASDGRPGRDPREYTRDMARITASIEQLIAELRRVAGGVPDGLVQILGKKASSNSPKFAGPIELTPLTVDPGDPPEGKAWLFVLDGGGGSFTLVARKNTSSVVTEWSGALT